MSQGIRRGSQTRAGLTRVHGAILVLDDGHGGEAAHHRHPDQLQADVQPLHGCPAQELAALVQLQAPAGLLLKPGPEETTTQVGSEQLLQNNFQSTSEERQ